MIVMQGDRVQPRNAANASTAAYRNMRGTVVEVIDRETVVVAWDCDRNAGPRFRNTQRKIEDIEPAND